MYGYGGNDSIRGFGGNDVLVGGAGLDVLWGGDGNDVVFARDGQADRIYCGSGLDTVFADTKDRVSTTCEQVWLNTPAPVPPPSPPSTSSPPAQQNAVELVDQPFVCTGPVDIDLVRVTMPTAVEDAIRLDQDCSGRIGRVEVDTWTADGIKVQNRGTVAHDLVIESGYVKCHDVVGDYHQDGIQVMGGYRLTFRKLAIDCLRNANLFIALGGAEASIPTDVVCERCMLGPNSAQTLFWGPSVRSGARDTTICTGRFHATRIEPGATEIVNERNTVLPHGDPSCADITGRGRP